MQKFFFIKLGKTCLVPYHIGDNEIPSIAHEEQKFLGKVIFFTGKSKETLRYFTDVIGDKQCNIDLAMVMGE